MNANTNDQQTMDNKQAPPKQDKQKTNKRKIGDVDVDKGDHQPKRNKQAKQDEHYHRDVTTALCSVAGVYQDALSSFPTQTINWSFKPNGDGDQTPVYDFKAHELTDEEIKRMVKISTTMKVMMPKDDLEFLKSVYADKVPTYTPKSLTACNIIFF